MQGRQDRRLFEAVGGAVILAAAGMMTAPVALADTSASRIKNCADSDWCSYHRTVDTAWRHSPLAQINKDNISDLHVAWIFQPGESIQGLHSTPLVVDGAMYLSTNPSLAWKLDARDRQADLGLQARDGPGDHLAHVLPAHPRPGGRRRSGLPRPGGRPPGRPRRCHRRGGLGQAAGRLGERDRRVQRRRHVRRAPICS